MYRERKPAPWGVRRRLIGTVTVRAEGRIESTHPVLIVAPSRASNVHLPNEPAAELRIGHFSEAVCQAFVHSF